MAQGGHCHLGQPLLVSQSRRRLPAQGRPHPLAGLDQRLRGRSPRIGGVDNDHLARDCFATLAMTAKRELVIARSAATKQSRPTVGAQAVAAPSTGSAAPETNDASSEIRKR